MKTSRLFQADGSTAGNGVPRVTTGNAGADIILGGGFPANSINVIMGSPGTGKTIFAQQLAFSNADGPRPVLYLSTLSEPLAKILTYLQRLAFYDEAKVGRNIAYEDLGGQLVEQGIAAVVTRVRESIRQVSPQIIIIDSFKAVHELSNSVAEMRKMVAELAGLIAAYQTTVFLVGEYAEEDLTRFPEFAVADSVIELARYNRATRDERYIRISKLRGSSYREGTHGFRITSEGLEFFPRLVSPDHPPTYRLSTERVSTGIPGLDTMLGGGLWRGTSSLVAGPTGSGKTTAAVQFCLEGIRQGEPVLQLNFQENPSQMAKLVNALGGGTEGLESPLWQGIYVSPVELQIDSLIGRAFALVGENGIRRVVVDGIGDLLLASGDPQRVHDYLYALTQQLAALEVSTLLTFESRFGADPRGGLTEAIHFSAFTDCIVFLDLVLSERVRRTASVLKARNSEHDLRPREFEITAAGIQIS
jgi:circadian clock protein KaiC